LVIWFQFTALIKESHRLNYCYACTFQGGHQSIAIVILLLIYKSTMSWRWPKGLWPPLLTALTGNGSTRSVSAWHTRSCRWILPRPTLTLATSNCQPDECQPIWQWTDWIEQYLKIVSTKWFSFVLAFMYKINLCMYYCFTSYQMCTFMHEM